MVEHKKYLRELKDIIHSNKPCFQSHGFLEPPPSFTKLLICLGPASMALSLPAVMASAYNHQHHREIPKQSLVTNIISPNPK